MKNSIRIPAAFGLLMMLYSSVALSQSKTPITKEDLVGEYSYSHRYGSTTIKLTANGTFQKISSDCIYDYLNAGTYLFDGKFLVLTHNPKAFKVVQHDGKDVTRKLKKQIEKNKSSDEEDVTKYIPVRWGDRVYLFYENDLIPFCNAVNLGFEPLDGQFKDLLTFAGNSFVFSYYSFQRNGDENKITNGLPEVPEEYKSYLLTTPLTGAILEIKQDGDKTFAQINLGRRDDIKEGMMLLVHKESGALFSILIVKSVQEETATVITGSDNKVGDKVFTRYQGLRTWKALGESGYIK